MILSAGHCQFPTVGHWAPHLEGSSLPLQNFLNHHSTVCLLAVPEPNVLLMLQVVSAAL